MQIIEIAALENGAHRNQVGAGTVPPGWAVIPEEMALDSFPFGEVEAAEIGGVMTVTGWEPGEVPPEPEIRPTADRRYEPGEYVTVDGIMYRVILTILPGAYITPGTNVEETSIEAEFARINEEE